jgi:hypothetical protein
MNAHSERRIFSALLCLHLIMSYTNAELFHQQLLASWKFLLSFRKRESSWQLEDYPIRTRQQNVENFSGPERLRPSAWVADIICWYTSAGGETKEQAIEQLRDVLRFRRANGMSLPRPGTRVPIEFASDKHIVQFEDLSHEFVTRILEIEWAWLTDESSLWDFHTEVTNDLLNQRISEVYGVDVSDVPNANIAGILKKIAEHSH